MSLLPQQILPMTEPVGLVRQSDGTELPVRMTKNWWLLLYNLCQQSIPTTGLPVSALIELASVDSDSADADAVVLRSPISNLAMQTDPVVSSSDLPDIARSLLLAQDDLLPTPPPLAQPVAIVAVGASPFTYKAPYAGNAVITGGTVSAIAISRQGTNVSTGLTSGLFPVSRGDSLVITHTGAPTMTFIPGSPQ